MSDTEARKARFAAALESASLDAILRVVDDETAELKAENERLREWRRELLDVGFGYDDSEESAAEVLACQPGWRWSAIEAEARLAAVREVRDALAALPGCWVGPWVHSYNALDALNRALDAPTVGRDETGDDGR